MMRSLFREKDAHFRVELVADPAVQQFIGTHASVLDSAFEKVEMSDAMRRRLQRSDWVFSGMKAFHELNEAFPSLLDENGNRKSFERFLNDVQSIDKTYNANYLRAEYNFVAASAEMAARWESFMEDGDRYYLQYRTQRDDKVRPEHAALDRVTLPPSDSFWEEFYPPNGWNCRCTVTQVRKSKFEPTDHDEAMRLGDEALQRDTKGMFRFNPGKEEKSVPDYNPYTISKCRNCNIAKGDATLARVEAGNELCKACQIVRGIQQHIENNRQIYERLKNDSNYFNVEFDERSGGVKATHTGHITHFSDKEPTFFGDEKLTATDLEMLCQDVLFRKGRRCILLNETKIGADGLQLPQLDTETDGEVIDIRAITEKGKRTIRNALASKKKQLKNFNTKTGADCHSVILYFHDDTMFDEGQIKGQLGHILQKVMCVFRNGDIKIYKKS
ncbi:MAG: phage minor head protein [Muribaculaceae bacterium]|nr:phage minor head protein [Muribaculaceae bacterium]